RDINIEVIPMKMPTSKTLNFLILFEDSIPEVINESGNKGAGGSKPDKAKQKSAYQRVIKLEQELAATREYLQSIIEDQEATNEDLRAVGEEVESSNEELQSTNEELETAKEELQSINEELTTVNEEL